jgi:transposase
MRQKTRTVVLSQTDRHQLESWAQAQFTPQQVAVASRILLKAADGKQDREIADELKVNRHIVTLWRKRFRKKGIDCLWEIQAGAAPKASYYAGKVTDIVTAPRSLPTPKIARAVVLSQADRHQLESLVRAQFTPHQVVLRCCILLMAAAGKRNKEIVDKLNVNRHTVELWRKRFRTRGLDCVCKTESGRGRKACYDEGKVAAIVTATLETKPTGSAQWSCRTMARAQKVSPSTVNRVWQEYNLKLHRTSSFKLSRDIKSLEKLTDLVGLYLNPPDRSLVLCIDKERQIPALDRTRRGLRLKQGRWGTFAPDYNRRTSLFRELEILQGKVIGKCFPRHRHPEFLRFLRRLDDEFPDKLKLHLVLDTDGTHQHPKVQSWLEHHPRFTLHFIPTNSSWLNQLEWWFEELRQKAVHVRSFVSVPELREVVAQFLTTWNEAPRPFVWTATVEKIRRLKS